eukprot:Sspe_Gene.19255::Locus_6999_Transcript_2_2_Confidence_0.400_Length_1814::g.19255::m.19255
MDKEVPDSLEGGKGKVLVEVALLQQLFERIADLETRVHYEAEQHKQFESIVIKRLTALEEGSSHKHLDQDFGGSAGCNGTKGGDSSPPSSPPLPPEAAAPAAGAVALAAVSSDCGVAAAKLPSTTDANTSPFCTCTVNYSFLQSDTEGGGEYDGPFSDARSTVTLTSRVDPPPLNHLANSFRGKVQRNSKQPPPKTIRLNTRVRVRCIDSTDAKERWDEAVIVANDGKLCKVVFDDGEEWTDVPIQDILPVDDTGRVLNPALPAALRERDLHYSGYLWRVQGGWIQSGNTKSWVVLLGQSLYLSTSPTDDNFEVLPLDEAEGVRSGEGTSFTVTSSRGAPLALHCYSDTERDTWVAFITIAILQSHPDHGGAQPSLIGRVMADHRVLPLFDMRLTPEQQSPALLVGYIVLRTDTFWFSTGDWGRRWVTLHPSCFTVRPDKGSTAGVQIYPLRDATLKRHEGEDTSYPYTFNISSPFLPSISFCLDTSASYMKWCVILEDALYKSNPDRAIPPEHQLEIQALQGAMEKDCPNQELRTLSTSS